MTRLESIRECILYEESEGRQQGGTDGNRMPRIGEVSSKREGEGKESMEQRSKIVIQRGETRSSDKCSFLLSVRIDAVDFDHGGRFGEISSDNDGNSHQLFNVLDLVSGRSPQALELRLDFCHR